MWASRPETVGRGTTAEAQWIPGAAERDAELRAHRPTFEVDHDNWEPFLIFDSCATQWRLIPPAWGGAPEHQGLEYASVIAVLGGLRTRKQRDTFARIRLMERGALHAMRNKPLDTLLFDD